MGYLNPTNIKDHLKGKVLSVVSSIYMPNSCIDFVLNPSEQNSAICFNDLFEYYDKEKVGLLSELVQNYKVNRIVELTPAGWIWPENIAIYIHGRFYELKCESDKEMIEITKDNLNKIEKCRGKRIIPVFSRGDEEKIIYSSIRSIMSSELLLVLGKVDIISPGSYLPWIAKNFGGIYIVEINQENSEVDKFADLKLNLSPIDFLKSIL
ncbi:hypothetical protein FFONT_0739 [Fervidicoccus fontis Kam940]|uniref:Uncharacterized protein n=1 Tax=Fervidicoccus fontis (strain DSM 19380 / JCM 18336 / VKM B-2539 / Kam940) TaxID=1163730 RepID=I0A170_FERFK|nr:hypothetical protein FFONT_0739 [Fervidicoccus fontis Kam940]